MKKKIFTLIASMLLSTACYAQNTTVTATVTDGDSVAWANATWTIDFVPGIQFPLQSQYTINGSALSNTTAHQSGSLNSSGALSVTVYDSSIVTPTGSGWRLNICPLTSGSCIVYQFSTAGGSQSISSNLTTLIGQPRFLCPQICRGYNTIEATGMVAGSIFYNTTPNIYPNCNQYDGASWGSCGASYVPTGCKLTSPVIATGSTTNVVALTCLIPTGTLKANSIIQMTSTATAAGGNATNCTNGWKINTTSTWAGTNWVYDNTSSAGLVNIFTGSVVMQNSTAAEFYDGWVTHGAAIFNPPNTGTLALNNATGPIYLLYGIAPGNTTDTCTAFKALVTIYP